uniref:MKLP1_Arf_bdg domain-containing protein n=1 Tax=Macrostomum lignano TaxID=282301 RepID=A0A1I8F6Y8_9PLAT
DAVSYCTASSRQIRSSGFECPQSDNCGGNSKIDGRCFKVDGAKMNNQLRVGSYIVRGVMHTPLPNKQKTQTTELQHHEQEQQNHQSPTKAPNKTSGRRFLHRLLGLRDRLRRRKNIRDLALTAAADNKQQRSLSFGSQSAGCCGPGGCRRPSSPTSGFGKSAAAARSADGLGGEARGVMSVQPGGAEGGGGAAGKSGGPAPGGLLATTAQVHQGSVTAATASGRPARPNGLLIRKAPSIRAKIKIVSNVITVMDSGVGRIRDGSQMPFCDSQVDFFASWRQHQRAPAPEAPASTEAPAPEAPAPEAQHQRRQHQSASTRAPAPEAQHQRPAKRQTQAPAPEAQPRGASTRGASTRGASSRGASTRGANQRRRAPERQPPEAPAPEAPAPEAQHQSASTEAPEAPAPEAPQRKASTREALASEAPEA